MIGTNFISYAWVAIRLSMHSTPIQSCQHLLGFGQVLLPNFFEKANHIFT